MGATMDGNELVEVLGPATPDDALAAQEDPYGPQAGQPVQFPREIIERCLFEIAAQAGNARKAHSILAAVYGRENVPSVETLYRWIRGRFRNRYHQISLKEADQVREVIARQATDIAIEIGDVEKAAVARVRDQLADANAVEASIIARNLSTSKGINLQNESQLRGRATQIVDHRGLEGILDTLVRLGVGERIVDADVVEGEGGEDQPSLPAGA
jgi:hypothetical protein